MHLPRLTVQIEPSVALYGLCASVSLLRPRALHSLDITYIVQDRGISSIQPSETQTDTPSSGIMGFSDP